MSSSPKHILILTPGFAADYFDTRCIPAIQLFAKQLLEEGMTVSIVALHYPYQTETYDWHGAKVFPLNGGNKWWKRKFTLRAKLEKTFIGINTENPVDIIHSFFLNETTVFGGRIGEKYEVPVIASAQGQDVLPSNGFLKDIRTMKISCFGMSDFQTKLLRSEGVQAKTIEWGIPKPTIKEEKTIDAIAVGNLIPLKQFDYFIELIARLKGTNLKFVLIGGGPEEEKIRTLIKKYGLDDSIELTGILNHEETQTMIAKSKVLVHPSKFEGFGMVIIEALANGTRVLSSPVGVSEDNGNISALTFDIEKDAIELERLILSNTADAVHYDIKDTTRKYLEVYGNSRM